MATIKSFRNYNEAKAFYGTLTAVQEPKFTYDPEFGSYEIEYLMK